MDICALELPVNGSFVEITVNVNKPSFWNDICHEVTSREIGQLLRNSSLAPWPSRQPPKLLVEDSNEKHFRILVVNS